MTDNYGFSLYEQVDPVNSDIVVSFNPNPSFMSYKLSILKDGQVYKEISRNEIKPVHIDLTDTGSYQISVVYYDVNLTEYTEISGFYNIDKDAPVLNINDNYLEIKLNSHFDVMADISANDNIDGNLTNSIVTNAQELDFNVIGPKKLVYTVSDRAGNMTQKEVIINVMKPNTSVYIFQTIFMVLLLLVVFAVLVYNKSTKLERKISKFSISPLNDTSLSLFDTISVFISNIIKAINKVLYKSEFIKKYSKRYSRYVKTTNRINMDFISIKIICSAICIVIAAFAKTIKFKIFNVYDIYLPLLFGFFLPDFVYYYKYKKYQLKIENDLLQAIIIMNNAFKSGRSIAQAIDLVSNELDGPMAREFRKMYLELSFGLGLDVVFKRFSDRINVEEVSYLTASLTILNKTGGNIVEVFSSIEKSLFNKKKLRLELKSLTSGSKIIVNVLMFVPPIFALFIFIINRTYFLPLFTSKLGYLIILIILIYYALYIVFIRKLLRVKM